MTGEFVRYRVPVASHQTVLDAVTYVQREIDPSLSYRFACRVGMCGSCAMMVNGQPRWSCRTQVRNVVSKGQLKLAPLRNFPVIKDLVCDMEAFFNKWDQAMGYFVPSQDRNQPLQKISPRSVHRQHADAGVDCINCGVCHAACDVVSWRNDYLGPAALNRAWTLQNDIRDSAFQPRLQAVANGSGCLSCHSMQSCGEFCPKGLNPTAGISGLKAQSFRTRWHKQD